MTKRTVHVGISAASLQRFIDFYCNLLGMHHLLQKAFQSESYDSIMCLKGARGELVILKAGGAEIELFEFSHPRPNTADPRRPFCDHGTTHFCIEVGDVQAVHQRSSVAGAPFHCASLGFPGDEKVTFGRDLDGDVFELLQLPLPGRAEELRVL